MITLTLSCLQFIIGFASIDLETQWRESRERNRSENHVRACREKESRGAARRCIRERFNCYVAPALPERREEETETDRAAEERSISGSPRSRNRCCASTASVGVGERTKGLTLKAVQSAARVVG